MSNDEINENIMLKFDCKICNTNHTVMMNKDLFETDKFPISYGYLHGDPPIFATLYIDANHKVRSVEFTNDFSINQNDLADILSKNKTLSLSNIPEEVIYGFEILEEKSIKKLYIKKGYEKIINFQEITKNWKQSEKFLKGLSCNEFFYRYSDFWIAGLALENYSFIIIVDGALDVDHLKTQAMAIFEALLN